MLADGAELIEVALEGVDGVRQPEDFVLCPFGVQFFSSRSLEPHNPVELSVRVSNGASEPTLYTCLGVTIDSVKANGRDLFCTFIKFLHVPSSLYPMIRCNGPGEADICDFCEGDLSEDVAGPATS